MSQAVDTTTTRRKRRHPIQAGEKNYNLIALEFSHKDKHGNPFWRFRCDCGNEHVAQPSMVRSGNTKGCGCLALKTRFQIGEKSQLIHGLSHTREHHTWSQIKQRCYNKNNQRYADWGGRGIVVCDRWLESFENFYADMGPRPSSKHSIDRHPNNDGPYSPENCRWATSKQQNNNQRKRLVRPKP